METIVKFPESAGIYKLTALYNNKIYIGKTINLRRRMGEYKRYEKLPKGKYYIQNVIIKHGWDMFNVEILEVVENFNVLVDNDKLLDIETKYIKQYDSTNRDIGYNRCEYSTDFSGRKHSPESRKNMSLSKIGTTHSTETKLKMSKARIGKKLSEKTKNTMKESQRVSNSKEETKLNRIKCRLGKTHSEESLAKMRKAKSLEVLGEDEYNRRVASKRRENLSPEVLEKMSKWQIGKKLSFEHREKLRQAKLGKKQSEETKIKSRATRAKNKLLKSGIVIDFQNILI